MHKHLFMTESMKTQTVNKNTMIEFFEFATSDLTTLIGVVLIIYVCGSAISKIIKACK